MRTATFLLTLTLAATATAGEVFIPVAYRGDGANGSVWRTEIAVTNFTFGVMAAPVPATITLHREGAAPVSFTTQLDQNEVLSAGDALRDWFGVESGGGIVRVTWDEPNARISARGRIYNVTDGGEYGQGVPAVRLDRLVSDQYLPGLSGINGNRTNVGVSNPHDRHVLFWITLYEASGEVRGAFATTVPPRSFRQFNDIFAHFQAGPLDGAMVRVSGTDATLYAYASVVRNDTGDATFVTPVE